MDITFDDVAQVIQDARYQQAILETTPKPDKKVPSLPRKFDFEEFKTEHNISVHTMVAEPLGRYFLTQFADFEEKLAEKEGKPSSAKREETAFLGFVESLYDLRHKDPNGTVSFLDIVRLLKAHKVEELEIAKHVLGDQSFSSDEAELLRTAVSSAHSLVAVIHVDEPSAVSENGIIIETRMHQEVDDTHVERYAGATLPRRTQGANTIKGDSTPSLMRTPSNKQMVHHSKRSQDLNTVLEHVIESICQPIYELLLRNGPAFLLYCKYKSYSVEPIQEKNVRYHRVLGQGAFGTVHGCFIAQTGCMLALKIMMKKKIKLKHSKSQVVAERLALEALAIHPSPYCMSLRYAFQTKEAFHLILPLAIGGDLKFHLRSGRFEEQRAKIYAAEIALGLGHIHSLDFIMRDLKPRNILLDSEGHCRISDFGLAAGIQNGRLQRGRAGTEGYWSPEVINNLDYGVDADWWSYGCCVFELLTGFNPFSSKHTGFETRNEGTRKSRIQYPDYVSRNATKLIARLLDRTVSTRLGQNGLDEVLGDEFEFWKGLDMVGLRMGIAKTPWVPEKGVIYAASQNEMLEGEEDLGAQLRKIKLTPEDSPEFEDFVDTYGHEYDIVRLIETLPSTNNFVSDPLKWNSTLKRQQRPSIFPAFFQTQKANCIIA